jgi:hypothetical protein
LEDEDDHDLPSGKHQTLWQKQLCSSVIPAMRIGIGLGVVVLLAIPLLLFRG